jgi:serine/threonine-protein kinase
VPADPRLVAAIADRYRVEHELGAGGMATVYLAEDLKHHRKVAIKVLRPEVAQALGAERFLREIATTANLRHPHILPLFDSGVVRVERQASILYYVMPLVDGKSLRDRLDRQKQLPIDEAVTIAREVADALGYAHQRGIIHRDIKPGNILLDGGHAVVADFGIARAISSADADTLTATGISVGTPLYMSPEQAAGTGNLDGRSDLYALGCVLYEMLGGQTPFTGPTAESVIRQHLRTDAPPITNLRPTVPPEVAGALARALAKNPADRFNPVGQFADALRLGSQSQAPTVPLAPNAVRASGVSLKPWLLVAAGLVVMATALFVWRRETRGEPARSASVAVLPFVDLSAERSDTHLGDGVSETLSNALANVPGLSVAARTSAFAFRDKREDVREIGRQLGVATVLEGSVQRAGDRLRVTAQLIKTADGLHLWSESFDRGAGDIFAVQDEVAKAVVNALQLRLVAADSGGTRGGTRSAEAYDAYLLGRYHWNRRTREGMIDAAVAFKKALALDSSYALAWSGLADTWVLSIPEEYDVPGLNRDSTLTQAEDAARRSIALEPRLGEAYASLGEIVEYRGRREEARDAFRQAVTLAPNYATGHQWYGYYLAGVNQWDGAIREMETAHRLDPLSHVITLSLAVFYDGADRFADATPLYEQGLAQSPEAYYAWAGLAGHQLALGKVEEAITAFEKSRGWPQIDDSTMPRLVRGLRDPATRAATIDAIGLGKNPVPAISFFRWLRGDEATLRMLEAAAAAGRSTGSAMNTYIGLGPKLRANPRLLAVITRMGLPPQERDR